MTTGPPGSPAVRLSVPGDVTMWELILAALLEHATARRHARLRVAGPPSQQRLYYRTRDGRADYGFSIERQSNGTYRSYVGQLPVDAGDATSTHRIADSDGRQYICWTDPLRTLHDALRVSAAWADAMQAYIQYGRRF